MYIGPTCDIRNHSDDVVEFFAGASSTVLSTLDSNLWMDFMLDFEAKLQSGVSCRGMSVACTRCRIVPVTLAMRYARQNRLKLRSLLFVVMSIRQTGTTGAGKVFSSFQRSLSCLNVSNVWCSSRTFLNQVSYISRQDLFGSLVKFCSMTRTSCLLSSFSESWMSFSVVSDLRNLSFEILSAKISSPATAIQSEGKFRIPFTVNILKNRVNSVFSLIFSCKWSRRVNSVFQDFHLAQVGVKVCVIVADTVRLVGNGLRRGSSQV